MIVLLDHVGEVTKVIESSNYRSTLVVQVAVVVLMIFGSIIALIIHFRWQEEIVLVGLY